MKKKEEGERSGWRGGRVWVKSLMHPQRNDEACVQKRRMEE
jgi:hypothetical protein